VIDLLSFEKILPEEINAEVLQDLKQSEGWRIAFDFCDPVNHCNSITDPTVSNPFTKEKAYSSDAGHILSTYHVGEETSTDPNFIKMNTYAEMILNVCLSRAKHQGYYYKNASLIRVFWNYYSSSSHGSLHTDSGPWSKMGMDHVLKNKTSSWYSLVYYLNTCEGCGTKVLDTNDGGKITLHPSIEGNAILFPSETLHGGTGAPHMKQRYCVNVMFEAELIKKEEE